MDTAQWPQEIVVKPIEEIVVVTNTCPKPIISSNNHHHHNNNNTVERKLTRPQKADQAINCPRCNSTHTKFCYYNNYSLTQPRYFCKTCRRYWTEGGSLRNIPVGGGSRKNKRPSSSSPSSSSKISISTNKLPDLVHAQKNSNSNNNITMINHHNHNHHHNQGQDLNLGFTTTTTTSHHDFSNISDLVQLPNDGDHHQKSNNHNHISALELLTGLTSKGFNSFMPMPPYGSSTTNTTSCTNIIPPHEFKPSLSFSLDGLGNSGYGGLQESSDGGASNNGRVLFPFEDLRQVESSNNNKEQGDHSVTGYWTGMLGGGSW